MGVAAFTTIAGEKQSDVTRAEIMLYGEFIRGVKNNCTKNNFMSLLNFLTLPYALA